MAGSLIAAGPVDGWLVYPLWTVPLLLHLVSTRIVQHPDRRDDPGRFALDADCRRRGVVLSTWLIRSRSVW
jgi:hypothetical protein